MSVNAVLYNINNYMDIKLVDFSPSKVKNSLLISLNLYHVIFEIDVPLNQWHHWVFSSSIITIYRVCF